MRQCPQHKQKLVETITIAEHTIFHCLALFCNYKIRIPKDLVYRQKTLNKVS